MEITQDGTDIHLTRRELMQVVAQTALEKAVYRKKIEQVGTGVYSYNSLPADWKQLIDAHFCNGHSALTYLAAALENAEEKRLQRLRQQIAGTVEIDSADLLQLQVQAGKKLATGYARLCGWLRLLANTTRLECREKWGLMGKDELYAVCLQAMQVEYKAGKLAGQQIKAVRPLQNKVLAWQRLGTAAVVNKKVGRPNANAEKVNPDVEKVLVILLTRTLRDNRIFLNEAWMQYKLLKKGIIQVVDTETGEVFEPSSLPDLSLATAKRRLKKPSIEAKIQRLTRSDLDYSNTNKAHALRKAPNFSLSLASMDDQDIPYRLDTGGKAYAYYIFEVKSGAIIGFAIGTEKSAELFKNAVVNLMLNPLLGGRIPMEIEVEQHISSSFKNTLLKEGNLFPKVRWALGGNPKEKHAEGFIKHIRYDHQRYRDGFLFRPKTRLDATRINTDNKVKKYTYKQVEAFVRQDVETYNNTMHPKIAGKTRLEVLLDSFNPNTTLVKWEQDIVHVGTKVDTSIRHNQYCIVRGNEYVLPDPKVIKRLKHYKVDAYYVPALLEEKVWLFQDGKFITEAIAKDQVAFSSATVEWTEQDQAGYNWQSEWMAEQHQTTKAEAAEIKAFEVKKQAPVKPMSLKPDTDIYDTDLFD